MSDTYDMSERFSPEDFDIHCTPLCLRCGRFVPNPVGGVVTYCDECNEFFREVGEQFDNDPDWWGSIK